jgi:DNA repair protein RecO
MPGKIKTRGFLIKKQPYSESSVLMQVFSDSLGMISVLAKGMHRSKQQNAFLLNILNEYEFVISDSPSGNIHTLLEISLLNEFPTDLPLETWICAQAGVEILTSIIIPLEETPAFYQVLRNYLDYQKSVSNNAILIFWRYLLHLYKLLGIALSLDKCSSCHREMGRPAGFSAETGQLLCSKCQPTTVMAYSFNPETSNVIMLLPVIGNYLDDISLVKEDINRLNYFFLHYLSLQFHKKIHLKSLQFYESNKNGLPENQNSPK